MNGTLDAPVVSLTSGLMSTFFQVQPGPANAPDLGVLEIFTPLAWVGDGAAARQLCGDLNGSTTTNQWVVVPKQDNSRGYVECLQLRCAFVVGEHNARALGAFVAWSVAEQVFAAAAHIAEGDILRKVTGKPCLFDGLEAGPEEAQEAWHEVASQHEQMVQEGRDEPSDDLAISLQDAFVILREQMIDEGTGAWYSTAPDLYPLDCQMPFTWDACPGKEITEASGVPVVMVDATMDGRPESGNGLLVTARVPVRPGDLSFDLLNELNRLDEKVVGASHTVGAWVADGEDVAYVMFLPAALLWKNIDWPAVMREILLTLARQALLARRLLLAPDQLAEEDQGSELGLTAPGKPHGLAWGETGEGRNPAAWYLEEIYERLVGDDHEWAALAGRGFTWWPFKQAQRVTASLIDGVVRIRVTTDVRANVPDTDETLTIVAKRNATLPESALVLRDDGALVLSCQVTATPERDGRRARWVQDLAIRQFIAARDLADELAELGTDAATQYPASGPRPRPDIWFEQHAEELDDNILQEREEIPEAGPQVALIATGRQYALPYRMAASGGGLTFSWRPWHTGLEAPVSPEVRVTAAPGTDEAAPAWIIRSRLPVTGHEAARARWCNDRNTELLLDPEPPANPVIGGWGLTGDGECCLTTGQTRALIRDDEPAAARELGYLLRVTQRVVLAALRAAPEVVRSEPLTATELATGLDTVRTAFGDLLGDRSDLMWASEAGLENVLVTCADVTVDVPIDYGRAPLALVYGELLKSFPNGRSWLSFYELFPYPEVDTALQQLEQQGLLRPDGTGGWAFDVAHGKARLEIEWVQDEEKFGTERALRVAGIPDDSSFRRFEMTVPPAEFAWVYEIDAVEVLTWVVDQVIHQVRASARLAAWLAPQSVKGMPATPARPYDSGRSAAIALRARLLRSLGSEPEWLLGEHDAPRIVWSSGPATTVFEVTEALARGADLGVLRVYTPVAAEGEEDAAREMCAELNALTGTVRWSVAREPDFDGSTYEEVQASCAFVVDRSDQGMLDSFALWCVREQIAVATKHILSGDIAKATSGVNSRYTGFPAGDDRVTLHPVTSFLEHDVLPRASLPAHELTDEWLEAIRDLRSEMAEERADVWFALDDEVPLSFELPFSWDSYSGGLISGFTFDRAISDAAEMTLTATVKSGTGSHCELGNGLQITVYVAVAYDMAAVNEMNRLDVEDVRGASHSFGGWAKVEAAGVRPMLGCSIFLPTAFAREVANLPLVMREIALTFTRQALLARRVLLPVAEWSPEDYSPRVGLAVTAAHRNTRARGPRGLAWGEPRVPKNHRPLPRHN